MFLKFIWIFLISMVPLVELRGAIPISQVWGLPIIWSYVICIIGNMLPVPFIYFFAERFLKWGKDKKGIPGTGAWTGTLAASLLGLGFKKSVLAVMIGVLLAGIIMMTISALTGALL